MGIRRNLLRKIWHYLPFGCFVAAVLCLCFAYGVAVGHRHIWPYAHIREAWDSWNSLIEFGDKPPLFPACYDGEGLVVYERDQVYPGVTLLTGPWKNGEDWSPGIRLVDLNGKVLHEWRCNPQDIWNHSPYNDLARGSKNRKTRTYVHGALLLLGGDVIFNLEFTGLARLNSRSEVIWKLPYRTHHSIFQDDDGKVWVCGQKWREDRVLNLPYLKPPFVEDTILKVSLDGVIEREISVLEVIYRSGYQGLLFMRRGSNTGDVLHLNDVEVLSEQKAYAFDVFKPGDIMVSMRHINTVFVIDGDTEQIKWNLTHPFIAQHDPDFTEDGYITVFDNCREGFGGSRILRIEPSSMEIVGLYGHSENKHFYTLTGGKHQRFPNGNMLITEARAGRVFEITPDGKVVWDWIAPRWDENNVPEILEGTRYSVEYADFTKVKRKGEK